MMSDACDVVVAGAGHNNLAAAAYLVRAGLSVTVVEARETVGGDTASEELTLPGFRHDTCSTAHNIIQSNPMLRDDELGLREQGLEYLEPDPVVHLPFPDGTSVTIWRDLDATCAEFARLAPSDGDGYRSLIEEYDRIKGVFSAFDHTPLGWGPDLDERLAGHPGGARWRRLRRRSALQVIEERFRHPSSRAALLWMAFMTMQPPQRAGTARLAFSLPYGRQTNSWIIPRGGSAALPLALARVIQAGGGVIRTGRAVTGLLREGGRCAGVELEDGERLRARRAVLSGIHIKHLAEMAPAAVWDEDFREAVRVWQPGVAMFAAHYATDAPAVFNDSGLAPLAAGLPHSAERLLRIAHDFRVGRAAVDDPPLLVLCPTVTDPSRAPEGRHTLKVVGFHPYRLAEGPRHWDEIKEETAHAHLEHLRRYSALPDQRILASHVKSPLDLERMNAHNWHGSCHGGDMDPSQSGALRPAPGWAGHRTPLPGLYQTGATTHPGGSVSAAPGRNAARVLLSDLGLSLEAVLESRK